MLDKIDGILRFIHDVEPLKDTLRTAWTSQGRRESTAEHTWRLCLTAMLIAGHYPHLDQLKILKLCIVHDLAEVIGGDIPAISRPEHLDKSELELRDLTKLVSPLEPEQRTELIALWKEYDATESEEAQLVKALDKLETLIQHTQGDNPDDFNYAFNLDYGKKQTDFDQLTQALRKRVDAKTRLLAKKNGQC